jgi:hypothetical protein
MGFFSLDSTGKFTDFALTSTDNSVKPSALMSAAVVMPAAVGTSEASASSIASLFTVPSTAATKPTTGRVHDLARQLKSATSRPTSRHHEARRADHSWQLDKGFRAPARGIGRSSIALENATNPSLNVEPSLAP